MSKLGERLKKLREDADMLSKDLASEINVEPSTITNWEKGNRSPKEDMLVRIADYFDCSVDYLLGRTDNKNAIVYSGAVNNTCVNLEVDKNYPFNLTPEDIENMLKQLDAVGLDIDKLIKNSKIKRS